MNSEKLNKELNTSEEVSLKELIQTILKWYKYILSKWIIILLLGILGGVLGFTYAWLKKPIYTATSTFVLEEGDKGSGGLGQYSGLASMVGIDIGGGGGLFQGDNIIELYKSRTMLQKVLLTSVSIDGKKELLIDRYVRFNGLRKKWEDKKELKNINFYPSDNGTFTRIQDSIIGETISDINKNMLFVGKPDKKLSIIKVEVKTKDEPFSKSFNDQIVKTVNDFYVQTKTKKSLENLAILQHQTDSVKNVLNGAIYASVAVLDATPNLNPTRLTLRAPAQKSQFNAESNKAILTQLVQNLELSKISLRKETPLIQVIDVPVYPLSKVKTGKLISIVIGGFIMGFLTIFVLVVKRILKEILT